MATDPSSDRRVSRHFRIDEIDLVHRENFAVQAGRIVGCLGDVGDSHDDVCALHGPSCAFDALAFDGVCGLSETGGIGDPERNPPQAGEFLDRIAGGARSGADDRPFEPKEPVEKAGFSGIWLAAENETDAFAEDSAFVRQLRAGVRSGHGLARSRPGAVRRCAARFLRRENRCRPRR